MLLNKLRNMHGKNLPEESLKGKKVTVVGSGNFGSTIAKLLGENILNRKDDAFDPTVRMWVYEEMVDGNKLTDIINNEHENVKYLPGIKLPENVVAVPELADACDDSSILVFVVPHQFLDKLLPTIKKVMNPDAFAISLIKGIDFDDQGIVLLSDIIRKELEIDVSVLMGANVASEIARGDFAEATIGGSPQHALTLKKLFQANHFKVATVENAAAVELCGALKNIVALGAGFCDGLGFGNNTKAAIIRIGMIEMGRVVELHNGNFPIEILIESCGAADLITTCYGGRNRKCAENFITTKRSWEEIEADLLGGQKLQGTLTSLELTKVLKQKGVEDNFPLFKNIYEIAFNGRPAETLVQGLIEEEDMIEPY